MVEKNLPAMREAQVWSLGQEDPWRREMATHSGILAWRIPWTVLQATYLIYVSACTTKASEFSILCLVPFCKYNLWSPHSLISRRESMPDCRGPSHPSTSLPTSHPELSTHRVHSGHLPADAFIHTLHLTFMSFPTFSN